MSPTPNQTQGEGGVCAEKHLRPLLPRPADQGWLPSANSCTGPPPGVGGHHRADPWPGFQQALQWLRSVGVNKEVEKPLGHQPMPWHVPTQLCRAFPSGASAPMGRYLTSLLAPLYVQKKPWWEHLGWSCFPQPWGELGSFQEKCSQVTLPFPNRDLASLRSFPVPNPPPAAQQGLPWEWQLSGARRLPLEIEGWRHAGGWSSAERGGCP